jgi:hypothetical protein
MERRRSSCGFRCIHLELSKDSRSRQCVIIPYTFMSKEISISIFPNLNAPIAIQPFPANTPKSILKVSPPVLTNGNDLDTHSFQRHRIDGSRIRHAPVPASYFHASDPHILPAIECFECGAARMA